MILKDDISWYKLLTRISKHCMIASTLKTNDFFNRNILKKMIEGETDSQQQDLENLQECEKMLLATKKSLIPMPVNFYRYENSVTITSFIDQINENKAKCLNGLSCNYNETDDSFISDLVSWIELILSNSF